MMQTLMPSDWPGEACTFRAGTHLMQRSVFVTDVFYIDSGRVALGIVQDGDMAHQIGMIEGPSWLNASCTLLDRAPVVDGVAETPIRAHRVSSQFFRSSLASLPAPARTVMRDLAQAHWRQTELAVSRLAKDAEARCAEWLLRHAEPAEGTVGSLAVTLHQRKRTIAAQLGIAPETLSRILRQLRERQLISGSGHVLNLIDPSGLRMVAGT